MKTISSVLAAAAPKKVGGVRVLKGKSADDLEPETRDDGTTGDSERGIETVRELSGTESITTVSTTGNTTTTPPPELNSNPTESNGCTICTDTQSPYMIQTDKTCADVYLDQKCNVDPSGNWQKELYCSKTCYEIGLGYQDVDCCPPPTGAPTTMQPPTAEPTTLQPSTMQPSTAEPTTLQPSTMQPSTAEPTTLQPSTMQPSTATSTTMQPSTMQPSTAAPTTLQPTTAEPTNLQPTTMQPSSSPTVVTPATSTPSTIEAEEAKDELLHIDGTTGDSGDVDEDYMGEPTTPTPSPTLSSTSVPTIITESDYDDEDGVQVDVVGEDRIILPGRVADASSSLSSKSKAGASVHKHPSKKKKSGDEVQAMNRYEFSPGCNAIQQGQIYAKGEEITVGFKYMVVYDTQLDLSNILVGLEQHLQSFAENSMINCPGATYVVNNGATYIDGVHIDLPSQPMARCGGIEGSTCAMLDGYVTIFVREHENTSGLAATQDALKALRVGMADELIEEPDGIISLSFLGGIAAEGDGLGTSGVVDNIPASARIGEAPTGNIMEDQKSGLSTLGIVLVLFAVVCFVLMAAALRKRVRFNIKRRALADSDSDQESLDNGRGGIVDDEDRRDSMAQSVAESMAESMAASCHGSTTAACGAADSDDDFVAVLGPGEEYDQFPTPQTLSIHQYCESPTCTICRSYKKPVFANLKYKVDEEMAVNGDSAGGTADVGEADCDGRYDACPKGLVARAFSKLSSESECYLCA